MIEKLKMQEIDEILELNKGLSIKTWPKSSFEHDLNNEVALINVLKINNEIIGYYDIWFLTSPNFASWMSLVLFNS